MGELRPCFAVGASDLKEHPCARSAATGPVEEAAKVLAQSALDTLGGELGQLHAGWTTSLLANLRHCARRRPRQISA